MKEKSKIKKTYKIPPFIKKLQLPPTTKEVYALIYSFTKSGQIFFGTVEYLKNATGISRRSAERALTVLRRQQLIEKTSDGIETGYIAKLSEDKEIKCQAESESHDPCPRESIDKSKPDLLANLPKNEDVITFLRMTDRRPKHEHKHIQIGRKRYVFMTDRQFEHLCELVSLEILERYVFILENIIEKGAATTAPHIKSHYRIIKKWIQEDTAL